MELYQCVNAATLVSTVCIGCSSIFVPYTNDPHKKLRQAISLMEIDRPETAEKFLRQTIDRFKKSNDRRGLADVYFWYGCFFRTESVKARERRYRSNGFLDRTATFDNRITKSIEYFEMSKALWLELDVPDRLANTCLNIGDAYGSLGKVDSACDAYSEAINYHQENIRRNPDAKPYAPPGYKDFEHYVNTEKFRVGCK